MDIFCDCGPFTKVGDISSRISVYKSTLQHGNADGLSRYPSAGMQQPEDENMDDERVL